ncbi:cytochrome-c oxidase OS=Streptomyces alboniger OX=132473 GN=coxB PE=3 SV=1 [Streptomyces alboniger]
MVCPTPTTEEAPRILSLWQGSWAAALAVGVLVWGLILWSAIFHRRSRTKVEVPPQTRYNMPIEALYTVVPLIIVSVLFYFTARDESKLLSLKEEPDVTINVVGFQWNWGFNYIEPVEGSSGDAKTDKNLDAIPNRFKEAFPANAGGVYDVGTPATKNPQNGNPGPTLWLPKGKTVRFVLTSRDVIHSFWGGAVPDEAGRDSGPHQRLPGDSEQGGHLHGQRRICAGVDHSRMLFNVKVVSPERDQQHLKDLAKKGQTGYVPAGIEQTAHEKNRETNNL